MAGGAQTTLTPQQRETLVMATKSYSACINKWMEQLAPSRDAASDVADVVLLECRPRLYAWARAVAAQYPSVPLLQVQESTSRGQKQFITGELIKRRVAANSATGSLATPKTREGKLAQCETRAAEWRQWAAEREGGVRIDMIEEHAADDAKCRAEAVKLPDAASR